MGYSELRVTTRFSLFFLIFFLSLFTAGVWTSMGVVIVYFCFFFSVFFYFKALHISIEEEVNGRGEAQNRGETIWCVASVEMLIDRAQPSKNLKESI